MQLGTVKTTLYLDLGQIFLSLSLGFPIYKMWMIIKSSSLGWYDNQVKLY